MVSYSDCYSIASKILSDLNLPTEDYKTWTYDEMNAFHKQYLKDDDYIDALIDIELANYDTSDMHHTDIDEVHNIILEEVLNNLDDIEKNYYAYNENIRDEAYTSILQTLENSNLANVVSVDTEFEPADPDVGIFNDERRIVFTLSNGYTISFEVTFDE